jgi:hypothetical protein
VFRTNLKQELEIEKSALKLNIQKGHPACSTSSGAKRLGTCSDISFGAQKNAIAMAQIQRIGYFMMCSYPKIVLATEACHQMLCGHGLNNATRHLSFQSVASLTGVQDIVDVLQECLLVAIAWSWSCITGLKFLSEAM